MYRNARTSLRNGFRSVQRNIISQVEQKMRNVNKEISAGEIVCFLILDIKRRNCRSWRDKRYTRKRKAVYSTCLLPRTIRRASNWTFTKAEASRSTRHGLHPVCPRNSPRLNKIVEIVSSETNDERDQMPETMAESKRNYRGRVSTRVHVGSTVPVYSARTL